MRPASSHILGKLMRSRALLLACLVSACWSAAAFAHEGGAASVIVPADHINPGEVFFLIASDFGSDAVVQFSIVSGGTTIALGSATAGPDGHFETNLELPSGFPTGVAELVALGDDGTRTTTQVQVGPRTPPAEPAPDTAFWQDPLLWLAATSIVGGGLVASWLVVRPRRHIVTPTAASRRAVNHKRRRR
jgi:hypothetical protein